MNESFSFFKKSFIFILLSVFLILIDIMFPLKFLRNIGVKLLFPITFYSKNISLVINDFFYQITNIKNIYKENLELKEENNKLKVNEALIDNLNLENQALRESLNISVYSDFSKVIANVISYGDDNIIGFISIDKGLRDGVAKNMPVVIDKRLVGVVSEENIKFSIVRLINSSESKISVKVSGDSENNTISILEGGFGLQMSLVRINQDAIIKQGDLIISSGQNDNLPLGLLVGEISDISEKKESSLYQEAKVSPVVDFENIQKVIVLLENE